MEPLNKTWIRPWTENELGILLPPTGTGGHAFLRDQAGFRRTKAERLKYPFTTTEYSSSSVVSKVQHVCARPLRTSPPAMDGRVPIWGEGWGGVHGPSYITPFNNKSWEKLAERVKGDSADWGVAALETRETFNMVANRANGLRKAYKDLRRGNFRRALNQLGVDPKRKHRSKVRSTANEASGLWLEYWFGWSPTVQDVYSGIMALTDDPVLFRRRISATAGSPLYGPTQRTGSGDYTTRADFHGSCFVKQGATFEITNENHVLLNRLGMMNPVSVMWEMVPFSFVIDWWSGVGNVIDSWTTFAGYRISDPYTSRVVKGSCNMTVGNFSTGQTASVLYRAGRSQRRAALTKPIVTSPRLLNTASSITRAATAVSLLTSVFLSGKR